MNFRTCTLANFAIFYSSHPFQVFRSILVPIAGLQEMLVRRDAEAVKLAALADIPPERRQLVLKSIAETFEKGSKEAEVKAKEGYQSIGDDGDVNVIV